MHLCKIESKKGAFSNSVDSNERPLNVSCLIRVCTICNLVTVDNIKSYMNQDPLSLFTLKRGLRVDNAIIYNPCQHWN